VVLDNEGKPFFQGWAIVDNVSDEDWKNVQLSLISGSPVSFIQNLQKPLYRYRPGEDGATQPLTLDSAPPSIPFADFANSETRYSILKRSDPDQAELLQSLAQSDVTARWRYYEQLAHVERTAPVHVASTTIPDTEDEP